jgi:poly-gamma-glutamate synthesis protein (capsule biosynthesis protein)
MNINIAFLANNHIMDYGEAGLEKTMKTLGLAGIKYLGAGKNLSEAMRPLIIDDMFKVAFINLTTVFTLQSRATSSKPGVAGLRARTVIKINPYELYEEPGAPYIVDAELFPEDLSLIENTFKKLLEDVDLSIAYIHWGIGSLPYASIILGYQKYLARFLVDLGINIVIGSHPYVLLPCEKYRKSMIIYSLGNFIFTLKETRLAFSNIGGILLIELDEGNLKPKLSLLPICINDRGLPRACGENNILSDPRIS